jgi:hypothetical protein
MAYYRDAIKALWQDFADGSWLPFQAGRRLMEYRRRYSALRSKGAPGHLDFDLRP